MLTKIEFREASRERTAAAGLGGGRVSWRSNFLILFLVNFFSLKLI